MGHKLICPKCDSREIIRVPGFRGGYGEGNFISIGIFSHARVTRYVCAHCGYSEEWIESKKELDKLKKNFGLYNKDQTQ